MQKQLIRRNITFILYEHLSSSNHDFPHRNIKFSNRYNFKSYITERLSSSAVKSVVGSTWFTSLARIHKRASVSPRARRGLLLLGIRRGSERERFHRRLIYTLEESKWGVWLVFLGALRRSKARNNSVRLAGRHDGWGARCTVTVLKCSLCLYSHWARKPRGR